MSENTNPASNLIPSSQTIRERLAHHLREARLLRSLLRLARKTAEEGTRDKPKGAPNEQ